MGCVTWNFVTDAQLLAGATDFIIGSGAIGLIIGIEGKIGALMIGGGNMIGALMIGGGAIIGALKIGAGRIGPCASKEVSKLSKIPGTALATLTAHSR